jgi:glutamine synthetase
MLDTLNISEKEDLPRFISEKDIKILNLCHIPEDGRLKTLSFSAVDKRKVHEILDLGERVDGSNLFSFIEPGKSDIYIMPKFNAAFTHPFSSISAINILCDYLDENGKPLEIAPQSVLARSEEKLHASDGTVLKALAELEFYIISKQETEMLFPSSPDKNYHASAPFTNFEDIRNEILVTLSNVGIPTKYGHSEVGRVWDKDGTLMEQQEIEIAPQNLADVADAVTITKWVIRNICLKHGVSVSFSPKVSVEHVGSGMHIHVCAMRNGDNIIANPGGTLSLEALEMIGGILEFAPSLSAFGNTKPVSYLRLVAPKESPMHICWGARNRLALIRIPLWWNFLETSKEKDSCRETFEYRAPDALSNPYLILAAISVAANHGLHNTKKAQEIAEGLHIEEAGSRRKQLRTLPQSCSESAENLEKDRKLYLADGVFQEKIIDKTIETLKSYHDRDLWKKLTGKPNAIENMLRQYLHYG